MPAEQISRATLAKRLIVSLIVAPVLLIGAAIIMIWLLGVVGIINVNG